MILQKHVQFLGEKMIGLTPAELKYSIDLSKSTTYALLEKIPNPSKHSSRKFLPAHMIRKILIDKGFIYPKQNISFQVVKGGAGKTTLATNFSYRCAQYGTRVLLIDLDQQGNASRCFDIETRESPVFLNLFRNEATVVDAVIPINEFLHIIPSNLNNSRLDFEMSQKTSLNMKEIIKNILSPIRNNYDLIIMDCPPAINRINATVTCASDLVVIPINPDQYALDGMQFSISEIEAIKFDFGLDNLDYKLVWNKYDAREKLGTIYMHALVKDERMIDKILPVVIRTDTDFKNSVHEKRSIFEISKKTSAKEDVDELTREILGIRDWVQLNTKGKSYAVT